MEKFSLQIHNCDNTFASVLVLGGVLKDLKKLSTVEIVLAIDKEKGITEEFIEKINEELSHGKSCKISTTKIYPNFMSYF